VQLPEICQRLESGEKLEESDRTLILNIAKNPIAL
jgi:hypothetical protein